MVRVAEIPRLRSRRAAPLRPRPRRAALHRAHVPPRAGSPARSQPSPSRDRGSSLLAVFMTGTLAMVGLIRLLDIIDSTWILIAVVAIYLVVIVAVIASVLRVMDDDSGD